MSDVYECPECHEKTELTPLGTPKLGLDKHTATCSVFEQRVTQTMDRLDIPEKFRAQLRAHAVSAQQDLENLAKGIFPETLPIGSGLEFGEALQRFEAERLAAGPNIFQRTADRLGLGTMHTPAEHDAAPRHLQVLKGMTAASLPVRLGFSPRVPPVRLTLLGGVNHPNDDEVVAGLRAQTDDKNTWSDEKKRFVREVVDAALEVRDAAKTLADQECGPLSPREEEMFSNARDRLEKALKSLGDEKKVKLAEQLYSVADLTNLEQRLQTAKAEYDAGDLRCFSDVFDIAMTLLGQVREARQRIDRSDAEATIHIAGKTITLCCGKTMFELPRFDRVTADPAKANCDRLRLYEDVCHLQRKLEAQELLNAPRVRPTETEIVGFAAAMANQTLIFEIEARNQQISEWRRETEKARAQLAQVEHEKEALRAYVYEVETCTAAIMEKALRDKLSGVDDMIARAQTLIAEHAEPHCDCADRPVTLDSVCDPCKDSLPDGLWLKFVASPLAVRVEAAKEIAEFLRSKKPLGGVAKKAEPQPEPSLAKRIIAAHNKMEDLKRQRWEARGQNNFDHIDEQYESAKEELQELVDEQESERDVKPEQEHETTKADDQALRKELRGGMAGHESETRLRDGKPY